MGIGIDILALVGRGKWKWIDNGGGDGGWNCGVFVGGDWLFGAGWIGKVRVGVNIVVWDGWMYRACCWVGIGFVVWDG